MTIFSPRLCVVPLLAVAWLLNSCMVHAEPQRPNIVFLFTDDQPQTCLGIMGNRSIQTPNIDRLARRAPTPRATAGSAAFSGTTK